MTPDALIERLRLAQRHAEVNAQVRVFCAQLRRFWALAEAFDSDPSGIWALLGWQTEEPDDLRLRGCWDIGEHRVYVIVNFDTEFEVWVGHGSNNQERCLTTHAPTAARFIREVALGYSDALALSRGTP